MDKSKTTRLLVIIGVPILFAFTVRGFFGVDSWTSLYTVMSIAFIFLLPVGVGGLTIALSNIEKVKEFSYRFFTPWLPIFGFFVLTLLLSVEGWACWLMILPVFWLQVLSADL